MMDIEKFTWSLKISWIKRILQTESNSLLKHICENVLNNLVETFYLNTISEKLTLLNISIKNLFLETRMVKTCQQNSYIKLSQ